MGRTGFDVLISPAPMAMVWEGPSARHAAIAVPGTMLCSGEALVQVELATICGSDVHTALGHRPSAAPLVLGHEQVGRVVAVGADTRRLDGTPLAIGERVVWSVSVTCGACDRCRTGLSQHCRVLQKYGHARMARGWELSGGFATHVHLRAGSAIVAVGESTPAAVLAPAACATATAVAALASAVSALHTAPEATASRLSGEVVFVLGAGLIGLTTAALATDAGATVILADPVAERRALAGRFGAVQAIEPTPAALRAALARIGEDAPVVAIEASGAASAVELALNAPGVGGVIVLVGSVLPGSPVRMDPETIVRRQITVRGVHDYAPAHLATAIAFLREAHGRYPFGAMVGEVHPLEHLDEAIRRAATGESVRVGVRPGR